MSKIKVIGHRGSRGLAPENTVASILKALKYQADEVEIDVRVSRDGVVVLAHNPFIMDASGGKLTVAEHNFTELKSHKPDLAKLEEAVEAINKAAPLIIEVKPGVATKPVVKIIKQFLERGWCLEDFLLASFDYTILKELRSALPGIELVVNERWSGVRATSRARRLGTKRITMNKNFLWFGFVRAMKSGGYQLSAYTLNDPAKARRWAKRGLYGAVTDFTDRF